MSEQSPAHLLSIQPPEVRARAEQQFASVQHAVEAYRWVGKTNRYAWRHNGATTFPLQHKAPMKTLDVGAASGGVMKQLETWGHEAYGVTGFTYGTVHPRLIVGDANRLSQLEHLQDRRFGAVMSRWTLQHLVDPLCTLEQMANMTEENGELMIDDFNVRSNSSRTASLGRKVLDSFYDAGFRPASEESGQWLKQIDEQVPSFSNVPSLHLRRTTNQIVEFPVSYDVEEHAWRYRIE